MAEKVKFGSRIGLIAATVGSAVGLGNVWRFPAEVQANGGAAFLLVYILCVLILGLPVMLSEFALGRGGQSDAIGVFRKFSPRSGWWLTGALSIVASYIILVFYMVVAGWTLEYLIESVTGNLYASIEGSSLERMGGVFHSRMEEYIQGVGGPVGFTLAMIAVNLAVLLMGVRKGIEKVSNLLMPMLFVLLVIFAIVSISLPGSGEGLRFFLAPDFSCITPRVIVSALGQAFFSLSLGMGILITYSAYYPHETKLGSTALTVSALDLLVALLMGFIIFPAVASFGLQGEELRGATLVFVTVPEVFANMGAPVLWSSLFFLLLFVAALTSTISVAEVSVAFIQDRFHRSRVTACLIVLLPLVVLSPLCALSLGRLDGLQLFGMTLFDFLDMVSTNIMLPVVSIFICIYMGWFAPKDLFRDELTNRGTIRMRLYSTILFIVRYVAPLLIAIVLASAFV